jgi:hypothetical protein
MSEATDLPSHFCYRLIKPSPNSFLSHTIQPFHARHLHFLDELEDRGGKNLRKVYYLPIDKFSYPRAP